MWTDKADIYLLTEVGIFHTIDESYTTIWVSVILLR